MTGGSEQPVRVAVLDDYQSVAADMADWTALGPGARIEFFQDRPEDADALIARLQPFPVIVIMRERTPFPRALIERLPNLRLLVTTGRRNAAVDIAAATDLGVQVCGTDTLGHPTVELTWALILALARHVPSEAAALREGRWQTSIGTDLTGAVLGIVGLGRVGGAVAAIGRAFGMKLIGWSQNLTPERAAEVGAEKVEKAELFARADVVTLHMVLSERTKHLVAAPELALMKPTAVIVNTSRGGLVEEAALVRALGERRIAGAGLDVFDREPLPKASPLLQLNNVVATPHLGYVTERNYRVMYGQAVEAVAAFLAKEPPIRPLNSPAPRQA